jgi:hypothetical protein
MTIFTQNRPCRRPLNYHTKRDYEGQSLFKGRVHSCPDPRFDLQFGACIGLGTTTQENPLSGCVTLSKSCQKYIIGSIIFVATTGRHHKRKSKKKVKKLSKGCQNVVKKVVKKVVKNCHTPNPSKIFSKKLSKICQKEVAKFSKSFKKIVKNICKTSIMCINATNQ